jgi:hypothetical protein
LSAAEKNRTFPKIVARNTRDARGALVIGGETGQPRPMQPEPAPVVNSEPSGAKSVFASKTFWILILGTFIAPLLKKFGIQFGDAEVQQTAETLINVAMLISAIWARSKASGPLRFTIGRSATLLALFALITFTGCAQTGVRAGLSYADGQKNLDVTTDGKSVRVKGGLNFNGSNVGGQVDLPLPRRNKGFAK